MLKPRSYQQEMLEEAMKQNVIVAVSVSVNCSYNKPRTNSSQDGYRERQDPHV